MFIKINTPRRRMSNTNAPNTEFWKVHYMEASLLQMNNCQYHHN